MTQEFDDQPEVEETRPSARGSRGCVIAVLVTAGVVLVCLCGGGTFLAYQAYQSPEVRRGVVIAREAYGLYTEARADPGARALREAGCGEALAVDGEGLRELLRRTPDGPSEEELTEIPEVVALCYREQPAQEDCARFAEVFLAAPRPAPEELAVTVMRSGDQGSAVCSAIFDSQGRFLRDMQSSAAVDAVQGAGGAPAAPPVPSPKPNDPARAP